MLVVIYAVHKRIVADVGALATLVSKSYKHFLTLLLSKSYDIIVSKNEEVIYLSLHLYGLIYAVVTCLHAIIKRWQILFH